MLTILENNPSQPTRTASAAVAREVHEDEVPAFNTVRSKLERQRASLIPPIPHTVDEVVAENEWAETWNSYQYLSYQDNDWGILIFGTNQNFRMLQKCRIVYMDGTFKICSRSYVQFFTILGLYLGRVLPFVIGLMMERTIVTYR